MVAQLFQEIELLKSRIRRLEGRQNRNFAGGVFVGSPPSVLSSANSAVAVIGKFTNVSGGNLVDGDVVILDLTGTNQCTTTTTDADILALGVVRGDGTYADGDLTPVQMHGNILQIAVTGSVSVGDYLGCSTTVKKAHSLGASPVAGAFAIAETTPAAGFVSALVFPVISNDASAGFSGTLHYDKEVFATAFQKQNSGTTISKDISVPPGADFLVCGISYRASTNPTAAASSVDETTFGALTFIRRDKDGDRTTEIWYLPVSCDPGTRTVTVTFSLEPEACVMNLAVYANVDFGGPIDSDAGATHTGSASDIPALTVTPSSGPLQLLVGVVASYPDGVMNFLVNTLGTQRQNHPTDDDNIQSIFADAYQNDGSDDTLSYTQPEAGSHFSWTISGVLINLTAAPVFAKVTPFQIDSESDADATSGYDGGIQALISLLLEDAGIGNGQFGVIRIGGVEGPIAGEAIYDPFWEGVFMLFSGQGWLSTDASRAEYVNNPDSIFDSSHGQLSSQLLFMQAGISVEGFGNDSPVVAWSGRFFPTGDSEHFGDFWAKVIIDDADTSKYHWELKRRLDYTSDLVVIEIDQDGVIKYPNPPTSDPGVSGQLFVVDAAGLAAALGGGAKYVLRSP